MRLWLKSWIDCHAHCWILNNSPSNFMPTMWASFPYGKTSTPPQRWVKPCFEWLWYSLNWNGNKPPNASKTCLLGERSKACTTAVSGLLVMIRCRLNSSHTNKKRRSSSSCLKRSFAPNPRPSWPITLSSWFSSLLYKFYLNPLGHMNICGGLKIAKIRFSCGATGFYIELLTTKYLLPN